jgi:cytochrome c
VKRAWILAALTVASVTGLGYVHPFDNPRVEPARGLRTLLQGGQRNTLASAAKDMLPGLDSITPTA